MRNRRNKRSYDQQSLVVHDDPKAISSEAFRTLRTNLQFSSPDQDLKTILISSAGPGDGKSTVAANLALAWSQSGLKVALVGCDLRKPVLHQLFSIPASPGLTSHLTGQVSFDDIVFSSGIVEGLDIIPSGPIPPNPAELLQSRAMKKVMEELKGRYDLVIFDGAPAIAVTDSAIIASQVDGTVLVVRAHEVPKEVAQHAKALLEQANAKILGIVLNGVRPEDSKGYHYYYYYHEAESAL